jgi:hypothetical protein
MLEIQQLGEMIIRVLVSINVSALVANNPVDINIKHKEPQYKDERLEHIYRNRKNFGFCPEERYFSNKDSEKFSEIYKISDEKYIIVFVCSYLSYYGDSILLLYTINRDGIEIKPLLLWAPTEYMQGKKLWHRVPSGRPKFDLESLILKIDRVRNAKGSTAEYKFEDDEFRLKKYTLHYHAYKKNLDNQKNELVFETKNIYP